VAITDLIFGGAEILHGRTFYSLGQCTWGIYGTRLKILERPVNALKGVSAKLHTLRDREILVFTQCTQEFLKHTFPRGNVLNTNY
jgi:hypothetical protein